MVVAPLKTRPVELTPELGMEMAKGMAALWPSPLEPRPKAAFALHAARAGCGRRGEVVERTVAGPNEQVAVGQDVGGPSCDRQIPPEVAIRGGVEEGDQLQGLRVVADEPAVVRVDIAIRGRAREDDAIRMPLHISCRAPGRFGGAAAAGS